MFDNSYCMDQMIESTTHILIWYVVLNFKKDDLQSAANTEFSANSYMYFFSSYTLKIYTYTLFLLWYIDQTHRS